MRTEALPARIRRCPRLRPLSRAYGATPTRAAIWRRLRLADGPYQQVAAWDAEVPWLLASAHAAVGAKDEALLWLDRAIERGMINYPFLSEHDWHLNSIRGEARFHQAMERAKREWDRFEV